MIAAGDAIPLAIARPWQLSPSDSIALPIGGLPVAAAGALQPSVRPVLAGTVGVPFSAIGVLRPAVRPVLAGTVGVPVCAVGVLQPTLRPVLAGSALLINEAYGDLYPAARPQLRMSANLYLQLHAVTFQPWQRGEGRVAGVSSRWDHGAVLGVRQTETIRAAAAVRAGFDLAWQRGQDRMGQQETPWEQASPRSTRFNSSWVYGPSRSTASLQPWRLAYRRHTGFEGGFQHGGAVHHRRRSPWEHGAIRCRVLTDTWEPGRLTGRRFAQSYQWGWIRLLWPRPIIIPPTPPRGPDIAPGDAIALPLRGLWRSFGDRIPLPIGSKVTVGSWRSFIMPQLSIVRLPDNAAIRAVSLSLDMDLSSWADEAVLTLRHATDFDIAKQAEEIMVTFQGYTRRLVVTGTAINRRHGEAIYTLTARSPTVYLGPGYAPILSYTEPNIRTAQQLAAANLPYSWYLDWNTVDWSIPGGIYTADRETPIDTLKRLADVVQAVVLPHTTENTVIIQPLHSYSSWEWVNKPAYFIPTSHMIYSQYSANPSNAYNAVYLSGTLNGGIERRVLRQGSAGNLVAPDQTNVLFVHDDPVREAGRILLSQAGRIGYQTVELPLADAPNHPQLLALGSLAEVNDGYEIFRGLVTQVKVDFSFGSIPKQTVTIERH